MSNDYIVAHQSPDYANPTEIWYYNKSAWTDDISLAHKMEYGAARVLVQEVYKKHPRWTVWLQTPPAQAGGFVVKDPAVAEGLKKWAEEAKNVDNYDRAMRGI